MTGRLVTAIVENVGRPLAPIIAIPLVLKWTYPLVLARARPGVLDSAEDDTRAKRNNPPSSTRHIFRTLTKSVLFSRAAAPSIYFQLHGVVSELVSY